MGWGGVGVGVEVEEKGMVDRKCRDSSSDRSTKCNHLK